MEFPLTTCITCSDEFYPENGAQRECETCDPPHVLKCTHCGGSPVKHKTATINDGGAYSVEGLCDHCVSA